MFSVSNPEPWMAQNTLFETWYLVHVLFKQILLYGKQGRRQDFAKGGADARLEMPTPIRSRVWGPTGVNRGPWKHVLRMAGSTSFLFWILFSLSSSLLFFFWVGRAAAHSAPPAYAPGKQHKRLTFKERRQNCITIACCQLVNLFTNISIWLLSVNQYILTWHSGLIILFVI